VEIYLIRHADAVPLGESGSTDDASRPLTAIGEQQAKQLAAGFQRQGVRPGIVLSSPLLRARQTAEGMVHALGEPPVEVRICEDLAPGGKRRRLGRVPKELGQDSVALVGHQPDLGTFASWLVGSKKADIEIAKAGVACIHCEEGPGRPKGSLVWLVTPQWLG
jgi:phosphohistidine phosphatase